MEDDGDDEDIPKFEVDPDTEDEEDLLHAHMYIHMLGHTCLMMYHMQILFTH